MTIERQLPREWGSLPQWVKEELINGPADLPIYNWCIQRLVDHGVSMKPVWELLLRHKDQFPKGQVTELLRLLHFGKHGPWPDDRRSAGSRQDIARQIAKDAKNLVKRLDWLTEGKKFPNYPWAMQEQMDRSLASHFDRGARKDLRRASRKIIRVLCERDVDRETRREVGKWLFSIELEVEAESRRLLLDARMALGVLVDSCMHWSKGDSWSHIDFVKSIGHVLKECFHGDPSEAIATLATAIFDQEVEPDAVRKILLRAA